VGAPHIGALVRVRGVVTHVTDVKPLITVATYLDDVTGIEVYQEVTGRSFTPLAALPAGAARRAGGAAALHLQTRGSKFVKFQEVKLQELPLEVREMGGGGGGREEGGVEGREDPVFFFKWFSYFDSTRLPPPPSLFPSPTIFL
jgi:hypothetical protein